MDSLSEKFKLHDKYQLELKFTYPFDPARKENSYHVDTYFFLPGSLGITPESYTKDSFYSDVMEYIRLKTPGVKLHEINTSPDSPLAKLEQTLCDYEKNVNDPSEDTAKFSERLKMFCSIMKSTLREEEYVLERAVKTPEFALLSCQYIDETERILERYRVMCRRIDSPEFAQADAEIFKLVDEFLSISANKYRYKLWFRLDALKSPSVEIIDVKNKLVEAARREIFHRKECGYPSVPTVDGDNEELIYRESLLKKVMASVLFLKTTIRRDGVFVENLLFGLAAGIAMAFATAITFISSKFILSELSLVFFAIIIAAYIGKDRMKDHLKGYFQSRVRRRLYDYTTEISSSFDRKVGICKESFQYADEKRIDHRILKMRHRDYMGDLVNTGFRETVILSRKHVTLSSKHCRHLFSDFNADGVVDIMRINIRNFLTRMDNPERPIFLPDENGRVIRVKGKRVYHINIIIRYGMAGCEDTYARYRIVLSRNGIKRMESFPVRVSESGEI